MSRSRLALGALVCAVLGSLTLGACGSNPAGETPLAESNDAGTTSVPPRNVDLRATPEARSVAASLPQLGTPMPGPRANGLMPGVMPYRDPSGRNVEATACAGAHLTYNGGPLLQKPIIVPVFWNSNVNAQVVANMPQFYADVTQSTFWTWLEEYDSVGLASPTTSQAILPGTAQAGVTITPVQCPASTTTTCTVTDAQIQTELLRQINAPVPTLPAPETDCTGNAKTIYMVHFPPNVHVTDPFGDRSCVGGGFCAYHFTGNYTASIPLVYGVLMDEFTSGCDTGCGTNGNALENSTETASHELAEAATDTDVGLAPGYAPPLGWYDDSNNCGEIADICDDGVSKGDTITVSGRSWVVQELWSNSQGKCTSTGPAKTCPTGDNCGTVSDSCDGTIDCGTCTSPQTCGGGGKANVCGTCTPLTTCPAPDNCGSISNNCGGMLNCGSCTGSNTCGGGGTANVCGCTPLTTCPAPDNCGSISNNCGGMLNCGTCTGSNTCGGGGTPNVCGCTPLTVCPSPDNCGSISNNCGGMLNCGTCTGSNTCGGGGTPNVCGCTPLTTCPAPDNCGTISDGCGGTINCGTCTGSQTCGGGGTANVCGCTPLATCPAGDDCGTVSDGCGGTVSCGTCAAGQTCSQNQCVANVVDAGGTDSGSGSGGGDAGTSDAGTVNDSGPSDAASTDSGSGSGGDASADASNDAATDAGSHGGSDAGKADSGEDSGMSFDSGGPAMDGSTRADSGSGSDSGNVEPGQDSGSSEDSGSTADGSTEEGGEAGTSPNGPTGNSGGCGCKAAGTESSSSQGALAFGLLAFAGAIGRSRRKRASK